MTTKAVYIHIPFCRHKCFYCDFNTYTLNGQPVDQYLDALRREMEMTVAKQPPSEIETIFIGGGTPTALTSEQLRKLLNSVRECFPRRSPQLEFTMEANPGTVDRDKLDTLREGGVNRLSMGAQSFDDQLLARIGRIHQSRTVTESVLLAKETGFDNLSIDLMFGLPDQTMAQLDASIDAALSLELPHYSVYGLKIEANTPFHTWHEQGKLVLPDEDEELAMYERIMERMEASGRQQYEISNFARRGYESRHNLTYWYNESYYGFGAGAHGYVSRVRHENVAGVREYIGQAGHRLPRKEEWVVPESDAMEDFMMVGLRVLEGVDRRRFRQQFDRELEDVFGPTLEKWTEQRMLVKTENGYRLSRRGLIYGNEIFASFIGNVLK